MFNVIDFSLNLCSLQTWLRIFFCFPQLRSAIIIPSHLQYQVLWLKPSSYFDKDIQITWQKLLFGVHLEYLTLFSIRSCVENPSCLEYIVAVNEKLMNHRQFMHKKNIYIFFCSKFVDFFGKFLVKDHMILN